jgi:hypothetical protein
MSTAYLLPVADGNYTSFTAAGAANDWQCIDDPVGAPDDATTRVSLTGTTTPTRESAVLGAYGSGGTINSVTITGRAIRSGTGTGSIRIFLRIGGTDYDGDSQNLPSGASYANYTQAWATNPATGLAWTSADLAALEAGVLITNGGITNTSSLTQLYAAVDYTPGQPGQPWPVSVRIGTTIANMEAVLIEPHVEFMPGTRTTRTLSKQDRWVGAPRCRWTYPDLQLEGEQYYQLKKQLSGGAAGTVYIDIPTQTLNTTTYRPIITAYKAIMHWPLEDVTREQHNRWTLPDDGILFTHLEGL